MAGWTLGGGFGYLCRKHGMTLDNFRSVDLVTAKGELVQASEDENPNLFWGFRGGSGNFGIVTSFEFNLHELEEVLAGLIIYSAEEAHAVVRRWWEFASKAPDELSVWLNFSTAAPEAFMPEEFYGKRILSVIPIYSGDVEKGWDVNAPLRIFGEPIADTVGVYRFIDWQRAFDESYPPVNGTSGSHTISGIPRPMLSTESSIMPSPRQRQKPESP